MDAKTFDRWTTAVSTLLTKAGSRRRALTLGASSVAGLWHLGNVEETAARRKHRRHKKNKGKKSPPLVTDLCTNGALDPGETDIDCGGTCPRCAPGKACSTRADCASALCTAGTCTACVDAGDCGLDTNGNTCFCRDSATNGRICTRQNGRFLQNGTCADCLPTEQCVLPPSGGAECLFPCGSPLA